MKQYLHTQQSQSWTKEIPSDFLEINPAVFETFRTYDGAIHWLDQHLQRLLSSAEVMDIDSDVLDRETLARQIKQIRDINFENQDLRIRVLLNETGYSITSFVLEDWPESFYRDGIDIADAVFERPNPTAKYTTPIYQEFVEHAESIGAQEIIFFDHDGNLREGNRTNVFAVFGDALVTPKINILKGVMRNHVIQLCQQLGLEVIEIGLTEEVLAQADEIILTNALKGIIPVKSWDTWERSTNKCYNKLKKKFDNMYK